MNNKIRFFITEETKTLLLTRELPEGNNFIGPFRLQTEQEKKYFKNLLINGYTVISHKDLDYKINIEPIDINVLDVTGTERTEIKDKIYDLVDTLKYKLSELEDECKLEYYFDTESHINIIIYDDGINEAIKHLEEQLHENIESIIEEYE